MGGLPADSIILDVGDCMVPLGYYYHLNLLDYSLIVDLILNLMEIEERL